MTSTTYSTEDGISCVVPNYLGTNGTLMLVWTSYDSNGYGVEADIIVNTAYSFSDGTVTGTYDFQSVMTHEIGHAHGLADKYEDFASNWTMYGSIGTDTIKRSLHNADITSAKRLYNLS